MQYLLNWVKQSELVKPNDLNTVKQCAIKNEEKLKKLQTFDLIFFIGKFNLGQDGSQNFWLFESIWNTFTILAGLTETFVAW